MNSRRDEIRLILTRKLQQMIGGIVEEMLISFDEENSGTPYADPKCRQCLFPSEKGIHTCRRSFAEK